LTGDKGDKGESIWRLRCAIAAAAVVVVVAAGEGEVVGETDLASALVTAEAKSKCAGTGEASGPPLRAVVSICGKWLGESMWKWFRVEPLPPTCPAEDGGEKGAATCAVR
jgi:hypothetical protein